MATNYTLASQNLIWPLFYTLSPSTFVDFQTILPFICYFGNFSPSWNGFWVGTWDFGTANWLQYSIRLNIWFYCRKGLPVGDWFVSDCQFLDYKPYSASQKLIWLLFCILPPLAFPWFAANFPFRCHSGKSSHHRRMDFEWKFGGWIVRITRFHNYILCFVTYDISLVFRQFSILCH